MKAMGFGLGNDEYKLNATAEAWNMLVQCKNTFEQELKVLSAQPTPQPISQPNIPPPNPSATGSMTQNPQMMQDMQRMMEGNGAGGMPSAQDMQDMMRRYQAGMPQPSPQQSNTTQQQTNGSQH